MFLFILVINWILMSCINNTTDFDPRAVKCRLLHEYQIYYWCCHLLKRLFPSFFPSLLYLFIYFLPNIYQGLFYAYYRILHPYTTAFYHFFQEWRRCANLLESSGAGKKPLSFYLLHIYWHVKRDAQMHNIKKKVRIYINKIF